MKLTFEEVKRDLDALNTGYKTADVDKLIKKYVKNKADVSLLRPYVFTSAQLHRIYFFVSLKQLKDVELRMKFIDENLLFRDWWHTDQLIKFVSDLDFNLALKYAEGYISSSDPFIQRWGYVLFISKLGRGRASDLLPLMQNSDNYYLQMAEAWLITELAIFQAEEVFVWLKECNLRYNITGKAVQKICDSFRISDEWKEKFKVLRPLLKTK
jgi:hypothetical protein